MGEGGMTAFQFVYTLLELEYGKRPAKKKHDGDKQ